MILVGKQDLLKVSQTALQHLAWRAGFGPAAADLPQIRKVKSADFRKQFLQESFKEPADLKAVDNPFAGMTLAEISKKLKDAGEEDKKELRNFHQEGIKKLNRLWIKEMISSKAQLREKMAFFWHDHFACRTGNAMHLQQYLQVIRKHALGKFPDLLMQVSKSAAMLNYLNASSNRKNQPNENFAREVMELFTVGKGNYSEEDIKEAARAFTGWNATYPGDFVFKEGQHDTGSKRIFGRAGNFTGEDVLNLLVEQKATARFLTEKIYRFFVNEVIDEKIVTSLSNEFYASGYDIGKLMQTIFSSDWFYKKENIGNRIKSPIELWVGISRQLPMEFGNQDAAMSFQRIMGQVLFNPPNVAGWPSGSAWIDSSSLMYRLQLPRILSAGTDFTVTPKADDDVQMGKAVKPAKGLTAQIRWPLFFQAFSGVENKDAGKALSTFLLQTETAPSPVMLDKYSKLNSRESLLSSRTILLMQSPEYQLC